ncbi:MAG TPA: NnrU family protein [Azospirillum sp.]|nr:NnrU family protein [Azospirillum sp.]
MPTSLYLAAAVLLFVSHAVPSWPGVRPALVARLGRPGFMALHSVLSLAALALFVVAYRDADAAGFLFTPAAWGHPLAVALMPVAFVLIAARLSTKAGEPMSPREPKGIYRVTRFPGSLGLLLWAVLHLQATGDARRFVLFATMAAIALFAMVKNDWVLRHARGAAARTFREETSVVPFAAILAGRQRFVWSEIGWGRLLAGVAAWALVLEAHRFVFGVDPLYWAR